MPEQIFPMRYGAFRALLSVTGMGPGLSRVALGDDTLSIAMGWAFRARIPLPSITEAHRHDGRVGGIGVHGFRGRWLVNGAASGLVAISVDPPARAWAVGIPVRLRSVRVSVEDPDALVAALRR